MLSKACVSGALFVVALVIGSAEAQGIATQREIWQHNSKPQKRSYLEGFCQGVSAVESPSALRLGELTCVAAGEPIKGALFRICGVVFTADRAKAVAHIDSFYRSAAHADIPMWAALASYNDHACNERNVLDKLASLQRRGECLRKYTVLLDANVSKAVREKHNEECNAKK